VAANQIYHEVIQVEVRDQSQAALNTVQKNVQKTEADLNRISKAPFNVVVKVTDMLTRPLMSMVNSAVALARRGAQVPVTMLDRFSQPFHNMLNNMRGAGNQILQGVGQGIGSMAFSLIAQGAGMVQGAILGMNSSLETSQMQFETLMGDADAARTHVADLFEFAKKTPFESEPVIAAARTLRTFGGGALDTMENMTMFGNAAAGTSSDIKEVSFWFGRAYAAIQAGQPFGEARMRLQELAILSPQAAAKIEALEKAGKKGDEVWKAMTADLGRFNGAMDKQATTWTGLTSTLSDVIKITSAKMFEPFFKTAKRWAGALNDMLATEQFEEWAKGAGDAVNKFVEDAADLFGTAVDAVKALQKAFDDTPGAIGVIHDLIRKTFGDSVANFLQPFLDRFMRLIPTLKEVGKWLGFAFQDLQKGNLRNAVISLGAAFTTLTGMDVTGLTSFINDIAGPAVGNALNWMATTAWPAIQEAMGAVMSFIVREVIPKLGELWSWVGEKSQAAWHWFTQEAWPAVMQILQQVKDFIESQVLPRLRDLAAALKPLLEEAWKAAQKAAQSFYDTVTTGQPAVEQAQRDFGVLAIVLNPLAGIAAELNGIWGEMGRLWEKMRDPLAGLVDWLTQFKDQAWLLLAVPLGPFVLQVVGILNTLWAALKVVHGALFNLNNLLEAASPLWDAVTAAIGRFFDMVGTTISKIRQAGADIIGGLISGMSSVNLEAWIRSNVTDKIPEFIKNALGIHSPSTVMMEIGSSLMGGLISGLEARMPEIMSFMSGLSNVFGGSDVGGWIDAAIRATGVPASWAGPLSQIIQHESGGNPLAANMTDVNAQAGNASVGLMQLTGSNRAAYTPPGLDPMDPIAQIIAGIRYIQSRYGDIAAVPGVRSLAAGGAYQPYDSGGVLPPGLTLAANGTGSNEFVLTPGQLRGLGGGVVFAPVFEIHAEGAAPGVGEEITAALEAESNRLFSLLGSQLRLAFGNLALEGGAT